MSQFFSSVATEYNMQRTAVINDAWTNIESVRTHCNTSNEYIALLHVTGNSAHNYCGINGGTYLVVYKVDDDYVYIKNPNGNASADHISRADWNSKQNWIKEAHLYRYWPQY